MEPTDPSAERGVSVLSELVRSKPVMALATIATALLALGSILIGVGYAVLGGASDVSTTSNLETAGDWLFFVGLAIVLAATAVVGWRLFAARRWNLLWESGATVVSTLLLSIGFLIISANADNPPNSANIVAAIGLGGWVAVLVVGAAQRALVEQEHPQVVRQAGIRLAGAAALTAIAISIGLPNPQSNDLGLAIGTAVLAALGFAGLGVTLALARNRALISTRLFKPVVMGLGILTASQVARAIASGFVFGSSNSLLSLRLGESIPVCVYALGFLVLGWAALGRIAELESKLAPAPTGTPAAQSEPTVVAPASWQPDPSGRHQIRWWDGTRWTEHVSDDNRPAVDPI